MSMNKELLQKKEKEDTKQRNAEEASRHQEK